MTLIFLSMTLLFSLLGFDVDQTSLMIWGLALIIGFVVGSGLKHSFKIALIILSLAVGGLVVGGLFLSSSLPGLSSILSFINPVAWLTGL